MTTAASAAAAWLSPSWGGIIVVRTAPKTLAHPYYGVGSNLGYVIVGAGQGATLYLRRGQCYTLDVMTLSPLDGAPHPLYFTTSPKGGAGAPGFLPLLTPTSVGTHAVCIPWNAPSRFYYQCALHEYMGGAVVVVD